MTPTFSIVGMPSPLLFATGRIILQRFQISFFDQICFADIYSLNRSRGRDTRAGRRGGDNIDYIHSFDHVTKDCVPVLLGVEYGRVVAKVNEKLAGSAVNILRS